MVGSACPRIAFNAAFGNPVEELRRWLKHALSATAANSPREALLCYPAAEWREIEELPDVALDKPTLVEPVGAKPTRWATLRSWLTEAGSGARAVQEKGVYHLTAPIEILVVDRLADICCGNSSFDLTNEPPLPRDKLLKSFVERKV
jgi:hypothetical protein